MQGDNIDTLLRPLTAAQVRPHLRVPSMIAGRAAAAKLLK
jgi:hypothetical protein